jgi:hypothetical protein
MQHALKQRTRYKVKLTHLQSDVHAWNLLPLRLYQTPTRPNL